MAKKKMKNGMANRAIAYAFTVGVLVALVLGLVSAVLPVGATAVLTSLLIIAGIVVGFFNITPAEARDYVLYVTALVIVASLSKGVLGAVQLVGPYLEGVFGAMMAFIVPSVIIVCLKSVVYLARD